MKSAVKQKKGKPGRKASGLRGLSPEAARLAVNRQALQAVRAAVGFQRAVEKQIANSSRGVPTLERLLHGDVQIARVAVAEDGEVEFRPVMQAESLRSRLVAGGVEPRLALVAELFVGDVERATIGRLTASYGEGLGGGVSAEPLRVLEAMDRLGRAQSVLTPKERTAVWGVLVFGLSMTDIGWAVAGDRFGPRKEPLCNAAAIFVEAALERMAPHYEARGVPA